MSKEWLPVPLGAKLFQNVHETALTKATAALENGFQNEAEGITRFPGLSTFVTPSGGGKMYIDSWRGDMVAASSNGDFYRIDKNGNVDNITGVKIDGGQRVVFSETPSEKVMAAGGLPVMFAGEKTEILSEDAPETTHIAFIDNYLVASEKKSGRFYHSDPSQYRTWPVLNVFTTDSQPDDINSIIVTPFRELMLCGPRSVEQFERLASGDTPFFRRWAVGEGVVAPYTVCFADNAVWAINRLFEFMRFSGQVSQPNSGDIGRALEAAMADTSDETELWSDAWAVPVHILGQKFILLQIPRADNVYGTKGITLLFDYRQNKWASLYGWDNGLNVPTRWPGWSYHEVWGRRFVGGDGVIYELTNDTFDHAGGVQRFYGRTAHFSEMGEIRIDNLRVRLRRGTGDNTTSGTFNIRATRDNKRKTRWVRRSFGKAGDTEMYLEFGGMGCGHSFQFEWFVTDDTPVEMVKIDVQVTRLGE